MARLTMEEWTMILNKAAKEIKDFAEIPDSPPESNKDLCAFEGELSELINKYSLEAMLEMPDFVMAKLLTNFLKALHVSHARNNCWHEMEAYSKKDKEVIVVC